MGLDKGSMQRITCNRGVVKEEYVNSVIIFSSSPYKRDYS